MSEDEKVRLVAELRARLAEVGRLQDVIMDTIQLLDRRRPELRLIAGEQSKSA